jgi:GH24 family phage-related lysozyme (muramidase)
MHVSQRGLDLIANFEGVVLHAYNDPAGHCTVGIGHLLHSGNCTRADYDAWGTKSNPKMSRSLAFKLLAADIAPREQAVERLVTVPLNQNEFDALVSLLFNIGAKAFEDSTLLRLLNQGRRKDAAAQFDRWVHGGGQVLPGLVARRNAEQALFLTPVGETPGKVPPGLPAKWHDHWRRPWLRKARRNLGFRHWLGRHGYLTPHFTKAEAASKDGRPIPKQLRPAARNHAFKLERIRHELGDKPLPIVSWYRSPQHNVAVGGARFSKHMAAIATDHPRSWVDANGGQDRILRLADSVNVNGFGRYPGGNVHMDSRWGPLTIWSSW